MTGDGLKPCVPGAGINLNIGTPLQPIHQSDHKTAGVPPPTGPRRRRKCLPWTLRILPNGDGITFDLVFVNLSTEPVRPALYFYDTEGNPIAAESVVDITGDLEISEDGGLTVLTEMEPLGELTISTHGRGDLVSGSVRVVADEPIGGVLRFDLPGIGVAGVGASPPLSDALFPVCRQEAGIQRGCRCSALAKRGRISN